MREKKEKLVVSFLTTTKAMAAEKYPFSVVVLGNFRRFFFLFFRFFFRPSIFPLFTTNF